MIVYGATLSPFVRKVLVYGAERGLGLESKVLGLGSTDPDFRAASPFGKIPGFRDGDFAISDSTAIVTYLEAKYPDGGLIPAEAAARARTIWYDEFADTILSAAGGKVFFNRFVAAMIGRQPDMAAADAAIRDELPPLFDYLEGVIPDSGHLVGDALTLADISVASPFANLAYCDVHVDAARHPRLAAFVAAMHGRDSFAALIAADRAFLARMAG
ncbi:MAG: glutathione S-transferase [Sphingomonas sp. SCN 67-18]|uniref:glutathione S-transferase family protein n=1 Tax=uncultured Sphingomonas sp. TaxID=158754 RepID=UPI000869B574|nr:glutathione S-transferase family protein [Sphingomonas sp. SCN 67-18]ODU22816.1 MAG: glutathione S-transferase [Sphingomonas sp. SCN 67-18]